MGRAIVLLSGGLGSTVALFIAKQQFQEVHAITFDYEQRHAIEIESAKKIAELAKVNSHEIIKLGPVFKSTSPLTDKQKPVEHYESFGDLPDDDDPAFVPGRSLVLIAVAANRAVAINAKDIILGTKNGDFGSNPDATTRFISDMARATSLALFGFYHQLAIEAPLLGLSQKDIVLRAHSDPVCWEALAYTHTSYDGDYPPNPTNRASLFRAHGFYEAHSSDPLIQRAIKDGKLPSDYPPDGFLQGDAVKKFAPHAAEKSGTTETPSKSQTAPKTKDVGYGDHPAAGKS